MTKAQRAFTLIETIAVMVIIGTVAGVFSSVLLSAADGYAIAAESRRQTDAVDIAFGQIIPSVRDAIIDEASGSALAEASETRLEFVSGLEIEFLDGDLLLTRPGQPQATLLRDITGGFTLFADGAPDEQELDWGSIGSLDEVRMLRIELVLENAAPVSTRILLRNSIGDDA